MFAYCLNNPVNMSDSSGSVPDEILLKNAALYAAGGNIMMCGWKNNKKSNTSKSSNNLSIVARTVVQATATELADKGIPKMLQGAKYTAYVKPSSSFFCASAAIKNTAALANNTMYAAAGSIKGVAAAGIGTIAAFGYDVYCDYNNYGGYTNNFCKAVQIDTIFTVASMALCMGMGMLAGPAMAVPALIICVGIGVVASNWSTYTKQKVIGF